MWSWAWEAWSKVFEVVDRWWEGGTGWVLLVAEGGDLLEVRPLIRRWSGAAR